MSSLWIKNPLAILSDEGDARGGIVIKDKNIIELVPLGGEPKSPVAQVFNAKDHVVTPGLVNCHHHFYQTLTRALPVALNKPLFPWLKSLYPVWANLTPDMVHVSTQLALAELMLSGCTLAADHHYLFNNSILDAMDVQAAAAKALGMRVTLTRGSMSLGQHDGGLPPQTVVQDEDTIIKDSERAIITHHQAEEGAMIQMALAPCSPFSVTTDIMSESAKLAERYNVRLHTHLAETLDEETFCLSKFGLRTVDYLESVGWLNDKVWLAHGIHFNDEEIQRLGAAGVGICHCPCSNMVLASGICRTAELEQQGCPIGLGVDGSASNDGSNMIGEARQALMLQRLRYGADTITHQKVWHWATAGGAKVLGREDVGQIAVGKQADFALFHLTEPRFSGAHDPLAALLLCGAHKADRVMVAGRWTVIDGELEGFDLRQLMADHQQAARELCRDL